MAVNMRTPEVETDDSLSERVNCSRCPGCFTGQYGRVPACIPSDAPRPGPRVLRPPLAAARAPQVLIAVPLAPVLITPEPALPASFDIFDKVAVARQIRAWYSAHHTPRIIAVWLNRLGRIFLFTNSGVWRVGW